MIRFSWCPEVRQRSVKGVLGMQKQTVRQQARLRARRARANVRQEQAKRERRLARWGETVAMALAERDAVASDCEQRAGRALRSLIQQEGLNAKEALAWCGDDSLTGREVYRLIRVVADEDAGGAAGDESQSDDARVAAPDSLGPAENMPGESAAIVGGQDAGAVGGVGCPGLGSPLVEVPSVRAECRPRPV